MYKYSHPHFYSSGHICSSGTAGPYGCSMFNFLRNCHTMSQQVKNPPAMQETRDTSSIPGLGRSLGEGNGNPPQYSCLKNPMDRGDRRAIVCGMAKNRTRLSDQAQQQYSTSSSAFHLWTGGFMALGFYCLTFKLGIITDIISLNPVNNPLRYKQRPHLIRE